MSFAAKKETEELVTARRFVRPDIDAFGIWIMGRLKDKFPGMADRESLGWLMNLLESREYFFITNETAVLLAQQVKAGLDPEPKVREIFCLCKDGHMQSGARLYRDLATWARNIGASEIMVMRFTDVSKPLIEEALGTKIQSRSLQYARLK